MPISYSFCYKQTNTGQLIRCIKEHIKEVVNAGFHIVATVCDQGSSNVAAIKELLLRTDMKRNFQNKRKFSHHFLYFTYYIHHIYFI